MFTPDNERYEDEVGGASGTGTNGDKRTVSWNSEEVW